MNSESPFGTPDYARMVEDLWGVPYVAESGELGRWFYIGAGIEDLLGYPPQRWLDEPDLWASILHPLDIERVLSDELGFGNATGRHRIEYRLIAADGTVVRVADEAIQVTGPDGSTVWHGVLSDVGDRKEAAEAPARFEARFNRLMEFSNEMIAVLDADSTVRYMSPAAQSIMGFSLEDLFGSRSIDLVHPDDAELFTQSLVTVMGSAGAQAEWTSRARRKDGVWLTLELEAANMFHDRDLNGIVVSINDVTDKSVAMERRVRRARRLAEAAVTINSRRSTNEILDSINDQAAAIIGAHQAVTSMTSGPDWSQAITSVHLSEKYARWADYDVAPAGSGIYALVCERNRPMRLTQEELEAHPAWKGFGDEGAHHPPMRGWLAMPLIDSEGKNLGLIQVSDKFEGEFTEEDEASLQQLATMASVALENSRLRDAYETTASELEALFSQLPVGILVRDLHGAYSKVNPAAATLLEIDADQLLGGDPRTLIQLVAPRWPDGRPVAYEEFPTNRSLAEGLMTDPIEIQITTGAGNEKTVATQAAPILVDGQLQGTIAVFVVP